MLLALLASCALAQTPEVKAHKAVVPPEAAAMTNDKWKGLTQLDPAVRAYTRNALAMYLKTKMDP